MIGKDEGHVTLTNCCLLNPRFVDIRRGKARFKVDTVRAHEGFGEIEPFQAVDAGRADDGFCQGLDLAADDVGAELFLDQSLGMDDAVGHIGRVAVLNEVDQP